MHQFLSQHCKKRKRWMHQIFYICWQMVSCWFMLLMMYLPLLDICGSNSNFPNSLCKYNQTNISKNIKLSWRQNDNGEWCTWFGKMEFRLLFLPFIEKLYPPVCSTVPTRLQAQGIAIRAKVGKKRRELGIFYSFK